MTRKEIKDKIIEILTESLFLYGSKITEYDNVFNDFNADLDEVCCVHDMICDEFNIKFTEDELIRFTEMTVKQIVDLIASKINE